MEIGIIGLPQSGKTTVFNSLVGGAATTGSHGPEAKGNVGMARVADTRLEELARVYQPDRVVPAEVHYLDLRGPPPGPGRSEGFRGEYLLQASQVDALLHVVRTFQDDSIPHAEESIDPSRDGGLMDLELAFADLAIIERRLQRLRASLKGAQAQQRQQVRQEEDLLERLKASLEAERPLREVSFTPEEERAIANYQFLSAKPLLTLLNVGEREMETATGQVATLEKRYSAPRRGFTFLCARLEDELAQLDKEELEAFRSSLGLEPGAPQRVIRQSYALLSLITFFTTASRELRAWTIPQGAAATQAAGKVHSDMERGFIRAEVVHYDDIVRCGSPAAARRQGLLRQEGKTYTVRDGDVVTFLFNL